MGISVCASFSSVPFLCVCVCVSCTEDKVWTVVGHDHTRPIDIRGSTPRSPFVLIFNYTISPYHLRSLVTSSEHCQQEVIYRCRKSRLFDTWGWFCFLTHWVYLIVLCCTAEMLSFYEVCDLCYLRNSNPLNLANMLQRNKNIPHS